ncbi:MAG: hypothetical protein HC927_13550 [Deltaproteobacteria bacterium]|nr:hypothetical protein [Deltaproteobacteria bacterium]
MLSPAPSPKPTPAWRYVVPNAITSASMIVGLLVMVAAIDGRFEDAGWLIVLCVLLDKLDGTAARLLGASSRFGTQLDSLADLVVFGVAPAMTIMRFAQAHEDMFGVWLSWTWSWLFYAALALFVVCSALRLAKFNVMAESPKRGPQVFFGMPTTLAGGLIGLFLLIGLEHELDGLLRALPLIALVFGLLMVSNLPLPKVAKRETAVGNWFQMINLVLCYACGFARVFPEYLLAVTLGYAGVGFIYGLVHREELRVGLRPEPEAEDEHDEPQLTESAAHG